MVKKFLAAARTGFYVAVTGEGEVGAGDEIKVVARDTNAVVVSDSTRLYVAKHWGDDEQASVARTLLIPALPNSWQYYFRDRLAKRKTAA
jgi:MOSC domain-containing protein YiiM